MILSVIVKHDRKKYANYYNEVITYLRKNKRQMLAERKYCGISFLGALLIIVMPSIIYFILNVGKDTFVEFFPCL